MFWAHLGFPYSRWYMRKIWIFVTYTPKKIMDLLLMYGKLVRINFTCHFAQVIYIFFSLWTFLLILNKVKDTNMAIIVSKYIRSQILLFILFKAQIHWSNHGNEEPHIVLSVLTMFLPQIPRLLQLQLLCKSYRTFL